MGNKCKEVSGSLLFVLNADPAALLAQCARGSYAVLLLFWGFSSFLVSLSWVFPTPREFQLAV